MPEPRPVVAAIVISNAGVLIARRNDGKPPWTFIAGEIEAGESPADAAVREVREETGLQIDVGGEIGRRVHPQTARTMVYIAAWPTHGTGAVVLDTEDLAELRWVGFTEADDLMSGQIFEPVRQHLKQTFRKGSDGKGDLSRHSVSAGAAVIREDGRMLAIRRADNGEWVPPGGIVELDENPRDTARREVLEETGVTVQPGPADRRVQEHAPRRGVPGLPLPPVVWHRPPDRGSHPGGMARPRSDHQTDDNRVCHQAHRRSRPGRATRPNT
jgi:8-oxo-dGTP pyrophosphatase MutT (NUDIX family)